MTKLKEIKHQNQSESRMGQFFLRKETLEEIENTLKKPLSKYACMVKDKNDLQRITKAYYQIIGSNSLNIWQKLNSYYHENSREWLVIQELKDRLEKIKSNEFPDYNQKMALSACHYLLAE